MSDAPLACVLEAILFASDRPLSLEDFRIALPETGTKALKAALGELKTGYDEGRRGLDLIEIAGGYRLVTRSDYSEQVHAAFKERRRMALSRAALETLAIIALKEPVIVPDIDRIRSVSSGGVVRKLLELNLIRALGRKDVIGRPILYGVAETFYDHFGLKDRKHLFELIQNLPALGEEASEHVTIIGPSEPETGERLQQEAPQERPSEEPTQQSQEQQP